MTSQQESSAGAHGCVGPLQSQWPADVCGKGYSLGHVLHTCHFTCCTVQYGSHCAERIPAFPSLCPPGKCTWVSLPPVGPGRLKMLESSSYLISDALRGPLRKDILPDELRRMPSREKLFECVKRVCVAHLRALHSQPGGMVFSPKSCLGRRRRYWDSRSVLAIRTA